MCRRFSILIAILLLLLLVAAPAAAVSHKMNVIVGFAERPDPALIHAYGGNIKHEYRIIPAIACTLPEPAVEALKKNGRIQYIESDAEAFAVGEMM
ncbi:MAG: hypothetical protein RQ758_01300, partial [Methanomicrobiaceae archaeon]|nr:hypothetical protein [Methanomicrobiaceae archaeon]